MSLKTPQAFVVIDLGYGDGGKGSIVDYLTRKFGASCIVRFNGGCQAAHRVVTDDGQEHIFAQFGSGTLVPGTKTLLSKFVAVDPLSLANEERALQKLGVTDAYSRLFIDGEALVVTPFHVAAGRLREIYRSNNRHGSCGMGVGETFSDGQFDLGRWSIKVKDLLTDHLPRKLSALQGIKIGQMREVIGNVISMEESARQIEILLDPGTVDYAVEQYRSVAKKFNTISGDTEAVQVAGDTMVFEGAQGVLLDQNYGFFPYVTRSYTTGRNVRTLLNEWGFAGTTVNIGVTRAYATRHGPGPFVTEDSVLTGALPDSKNGFNQWQREFRVGWLDLLALKYALKAAEGINRLAVTNLDRLSALTGWRICEAYSVDKNRMKLAPAYFEFGDANERKANCIRFYPGCRVNDTRTDILQNCRPILRRLDDNLISDQLCSILESELGIPIGITSYGPAAKDKQLLF